MTLATMNSHSQPPPAHTAWTHPERVLILCSCVAVLAIVAIVTFLLMRERANVEDTAARSANNIVELINTDIERNVELYDLSLQNLIWAVGRAELLAIPPELRQRVLFNQAFAAPVRGDILWLDRHGDVAADSTQVPPRSANFADTEVFQAHRAHNHADLVISPPFQARLGDLDWCIGFSRRINDANGTFAGVAAGALRLSYFNELLQRLDIGKDSSINLLNTDGTLLARHPSRTHNNQIGANFANRPNFQRVLAERTGSFTTYSVSDNKQRLYTFSTVGALPLVVLVALSTDEIYSSWRRTAAVVSIATGVLCIGILWLTLLLGRELRRRHSAEQSLLELAATDSLTGLANRRQLDQVLRREWARAQRSHRPLAVLMVDVDHFKAFNARHGHAGGDHALREVAAAIKRSIRRPADLVARYGGEEFLVVLPETELSGALTLAERIRSSVEVLAPLTENAGSVTVSIGIGVCTGNARHTLANVLGAADEALYRAKEKGRNRIEGPINQD